MKIHEREKEKHPERKKEEHPEREKEEHPEREKRNTRNGKFKKKKGN